MYNQHSQDGYSYSRKRTGPLAKLSVIIGGLALIFVLSQLLLDVFGSDDEGYVAPVANLGTTPQIAPVKVVSVTSPDDQTTSQFPVSQPRQIAIPLKTDQAPQSTSVNLETRKDVAMIPQTAPPSDSDIATAQVAKVGTFIRQWAGTEDKTKIRTYARTTSTLKQCGLVHIQTLKLYEGQNKEAYEQIVRRRAKQLEKAQSQASVPPAANMTARPFGTSDIINTDAQNGAIAGFKQAWEAGKVDVADEPFPEELSSESCKLLAANVKAGLFQVSL